MFGLLSGCIVSWSVYEFVMSPCNTFKFPFRQFTVRYREKERDKKWKYQLCPTSETTIDNLKPNTVYEFGIRITKAKEDGIWSKPKTYTTTVTRKIFCVIYDSTNIVF